MSAISGDWEEPEVIFESTNKNYSSLISFIGKVRDNPMHFEARHLKIFNPFAFMQKEKSEEPLLKFADLASHAVYQCVNKTDTNFHIPEPRYLKEISSCFGADDKGKVLGVGLKCIHDVDQLDLDDDIADFWKELRAKPRPR